MMAIKCEDKVYQGFSVKVEREMTTLLFKPMTSLLPLMVYQMKDTLSSLTKFVNCPQHIAYLLILTNIQLENVVNIHVVFQIRMDGTQK